MQIIRGVVLVVLSGIFASHSLAEESACAQIENARERLACFDRQYPRDENKPNYIPSDAPRIISQPVQPPSAAQTANDPASTSGPVPTSGPAPTNTPVPTTDEASSKPELAPLPSKGGLFSRPEKVNISSTIAAIKAEEQKRSVYRLENEQIWMQINPRFLPFKVGDEVTIKSGIVGGYIMRNQGDTSTRVKRIK